ncbi:MmpS family transport accessory protein [Lysinibacter sp. HNR]|uniref:MmpS family transport accessory protein n=1 Tax=Lysinibacter sp. HNR TaxID=3031408 RepID=UPI0024351C81|nr:MmpS family transport accessory protein [Lysinibacter sp. HNR]WGD37899.1 MmpS family transport accessory protein [Lysinibacter sp. HNR]
MTYPETNTPQIDSPRRDVTNGFGITGMVLGIIALVFSPLPVINLLALILAILGLIFGIIGLAVKGRSKGTALAGTIISTIATIVSVTLFIVYASFFNAVIHASGLIKEEAERIVARHTPVSVEYQMTGSGAADVSFSSYIDGAWEMYHEQPQLPWSTETDGRVAHFDVLKLNGTNRADSTGEINCKILIDGKVIAEETNSGSLARVTCRVTGRQIIAQVD